MKLIHFLYILIVSIFLFSCSNQQNAESLIKTYLKKELNDADSYEPVEFGALQELHVSPIDRQFYLMTPFDKDSFKDMEKKETKELQGYYMKHSFRAKNSFGGVVKENYEFYFDKNVTKIVDVYKPKY